MTSAKIRQVVKIIHKEVQEHKFIVFSQFTSMLDLIEPFFRKEGFKFTRYDGGMKNDAREESPLAYHMLLSTQAQGSTVRNARRCAGEFQGVYI